MECRFADVYRMRPYIPKSIRQLKRLLKGISIGMLTTQTPTGESHARPITRVFGAAKALITGRRYEAGRYGMLELVSAF